MVAQQAVRIPFIPQEVKVTTYDDGYRLILVNKPGSVFTVSTWVQTGSIHETETNSGVSHFLEHLMFKGTDRCKPGEFDRRMESMGAIINAATWKDFTFYYITGPNYADNFDRALDMHADMLQHSTIPDKEVGPAYNPDDPNYTGEKRERSVVIEEIGMRDDQPWTKVYNAVNEMMYVPDHPYRRDVIGTRQIIGNIDRNHILEYYHTWYTPSTMTTIVVGDFDPTVIEPKVRNAFMALSGKTPPQVTYPTQAAANGPRYVENTGPYQTSFFMTGFHGPKPEQLKHSIALDVFSYLLGEGRSSRFNQNLIEKAEVPLFNMLNSGQSSFKLGNVFFIQGNLNTTDTKAALQLVENELTGLLDTLTQAEVDRACKKLKSDFAETAETTSGIAETLGEAMTIIGNLTGYSDYLPILESLTLADVLAAARQYLTPDKGYTSVLIGQQPS
jgi:zinc protease